MVGFALLASVLVLGTSEPRVLTIKFDAARTWPKEVTIPRGTVLRFEGRADSGVATAFVVRDAGRPVGRTTSAAEWSIDWNSSSAPSGPSVLEVAFRPDGGDEDLMARIDLEVLDRSPFSFTSIGTAPNGDPLLRLSSTFLEPVRSLLTEVGDKTVTCRSKDGVAYELPISGLPPGQRKVPLTLITNSGAVFDAGEFDLVVPERVAFKEAKPLVVERTPDNSDSAVRLTCTFSAGFTSSNVDVDLKGGGVFIPGSGGGQVLLTLDSLPEGHRSITLQATGPDGTVYLSQPRELQVHSSPAYVTFRAVENCRPVFEDCAQYLQGVMFQAMDTDLSVRNTGDGREAATTWDTAQSEIADAILTAQGQEPEGLAAADTAKVVPGLNHVYQNWLLYGAILARDLGDSWRSIPLDDFARFATDLQARSRSLQLADQAIGDAADAKHNLVNAFARMNKELPESRLQIADPFEVPPELTHWIKQRAGVFRLLSDTVRMVNEAAPLEPAEIRARAAYIRSSQFGVPMSDTGSSFLRMATAALGGALEQMAMAKEYARQRQAILDAYSGDLSNARQEDRQRVDMLDKEIQVCEQQKGAQLDSAMGLIGQLLTRERMAVTRSQSS